MVLILFVLIGKDIVRSDMLNKRGERMRYEYVYLPDIRALANFIEEANRNKYTIVTMTESELGYTIIYKH